METALALPPDISVWIEAKDKAVASIEEGFKKLNEAEVYLNEIGTYIIPHDAKPQGRLEKIKKDIDQRLWSKVILESGLSQLMDDQEKKKFRNSIESEAPEFTIENLQSTFLNQVQNAGEMFSRGIVNVFQKACGHYKTNSAFKVNPKIILSWMTEVNYNGNLRIMYQAASRVADIDRVIKVLDGKKFENSELRDSMTEKWKDGNNLYEDSYYLIRGFKNGNLHLTFKRLDLLKQVNRIISQYFDGNAIPNEESF